MNKLILVNFKAFLSQTEINFDSQNAIIYGENGSGKSSIYDALKLWFHTSEVFDHRCDKSLTSLADIQNDKNDILDSYNHQKNPNTRFSLTLNGVSYNSTTTPTGFNVCMINRMDIEVNNSINLTKLLSNVIVEIKNPSTFIASKKEELEELVNATVNKDFCEPSIEISLNYNNPDWFITVKDKKRNITKSSDLHVYFNEGKLHVIMLVFLLTVAQLNSNTSNKKVLVLDDVITSLDAANRTFFLKYIHDYFGKWQKIIMTHSSSFFNQMDYSFKKAWMEGNQWKAFRVLEQIEESSVIEINELNSGKELRNIFVQRTRSGHSLPSSLPNDIRKRFEYLVAGLSDLLCIGGISETSQILKAINANKDYYYYYDATTKSKSIFDMVDEMIATITGSASCQLQTDLNNIINKYKSSTELSKLAGFLQSLMIYQKVTMHAGSHASGPIAPLTAPEMDRCITLIQEMEKLMGKLVDRDMYSI